MGKHSANRRTRSGGSALRWRVYLTLLLLVSVLATLVPIPASHAQSRRRSILVLHSYHRGLSWTDGVTEGLEEVLNPTERNLEMYYEYMDTKRFSPSEELYEELYTLYDEKYANVPLDLIVVVDNNALQFMLQYHTDLFPTVPVVFCGINFFEDSMLTGQTNHFTGVVEETDLQVTLDTALQLHPDTQQIVVINDATTTGQAYSRLMQAAMPLYENRVDFIVYENPDIQELIGHLENLPSDTLILLLLLNRDRAGRFFTYEQSIELISRHTRAPIYSLWDFYLGHGMVGGMLTNAQSQGEAAGELAIDILEGQSIASIPIVRESPNLYLFDYEQMTRFGIRPDDLPVGSVIINRPPSFYQRYRTAIWGTLISFMVLGSVIAIQRFNLLRRRRVEEELRVSNMELQRIQETLEAHVAERTRKLEERTKQLETAGRVAREAAGIHDVTQLLDATVHLISSRFGFYHAGIFLTDETRTIASLTAASSEGGQRMLARGHRLRIGTGIVGSVLETGEPRIALDVGQDAAWFDNPDLPLTRSEMALPLQVRGRLIGVLDVQSTEPAAFSDEDITVLETMAEQLALAIENARLLEESRRAVQEVERLYGQQVRTAWDQQIAAQPLVYRYTGLGIESLPVSQIGGDGDGASSTEEASSTKEKRSLVAEVSLRDQILAQIELERDTEKRPWTAEEKALVEAISTQAALALDNARLFEEAQRRAARERLTREITDHIRSATSVEQAVQRAVRELGRVLEASEVAARLGTQRDLLSDEEGKV